MRRINKMRVKELIKRLKEVEKIEPNSTVYLTTENNTFDFTGFCVDDVCDVELYVSADDEEA